MLESFLQHSCFPVDIGKFSTPPILENMCERLLLNVVFNSNAEQYLFAKIDEMGQNIIIFYICLYYYLILSYIILLFAIIIFVLYPEAVARRCSLKMQFKNFCKNHQKTHVLDSLF